MEFCKQLKMLYICHPKNSYCVQGIHDMTWMSLQPATMDHPGPPAAANCLLIYQTGVDACCSAKKNQQAGGKQRVFSFTTDTSYQDRHITLTAVGFCNIRIQLPLQRFGSHLMGWTRKATGVLYASRQWCTDSHHFTSSGSLLVWVSIFLTTLNHRIVFICAMVWW